jgi:hypothetical protein
MAQMLARRQAMIGTPAQPTEELRQQDPGPAVTDDELYERLGDPEAWNEQAWDASSAGETARRNVHRAGRHGRFLR